jgi:hypothetical protein
MDIGSQGMPIDKDVKMHKEIAAKNPQKGDIFYVQVNKKYFFMQVIHLVENLPAPYNTPNFKHGIFVLFFQKTFSQLPTTIADLDLQNIYQPKFIWKKMLFYFSLWGAEPHIKFDASLMRYDYKDKYALTFFGNAAVSNVLNPSIIEQFGMPAIGVDNENGIQISHSPQSIQGIIWAIEEDEKGKTKKKNSITPRYFAEWLENVEPDCIVKTEKILHDFELQEVELQELDLKVIAQAEKALKKAVLALNKLEEKMGFIYSIEAENLHEKLIELSIKKGIAEPLAQTIIDENRDW